MTEDIKWTWYNHLKIYQYFPIKSKYHVQHTESMNFPLSGKIANALKHRGSNMQIRCVKAITGTCIVSSIGQIGSGQGTLQAMGSMQNGIE